MKPRLTRTLGALVVAASTLSSSVFAETLQDIFQQARQNDHRFQAAKADLKAGQEQIAIGRAALLPQISANANWEDSKGDIGDSSTTTLSAELNQSLFNLAAWQNYKVSKKAVGIAEAQYAIAEQDIILRAAYAYFDALKAVEYLATAKAEEEALSHQLEQTKQRFEVGLTAITEVHEAQAVYDSATANRLVAEGNLGIAFEALEVLTGKSYSSLAPLKDSFPVDPPNPLERKPWEDLALENNLQLKVAELSKDASKLQANIAKSGHLPTLSGSIRHVDQTVDYDSSSLEVERDGLTVSLNLSVPLFSGGSVSATRRQAAYNAISSREIYQQTQRDVVQGARASHLSVLTSAASVKARKQAITSSRSALEATQAGYDVGTRDLVDVLNAQKNLYVAQRNYYDALYSYIVATLTLKQTAGVLNEQDIATLDAQLDRTRSVDYNN